MTSYTIQSRDITFAQDKQILDEKLKLNREKRLACSVQYTEEVDTILNAYRITYVYFFEEEAI